MHFSIFKEWTLPLHRYCSASTTPNHHHHRHRHTITTNVCPSLQIVRLLHFQVHSIHRLPSLLTTFISGRPLKPCICSALFHSISPCMLSTAPIRSNWYDFPQSATGPFQCNSSSIQMDDDKRVQSNLRLTVLCHRLHANLQSNDASDMHRHVGTHRPPLQICIGMQQQQQFRSSSLVRRPLPWLLKAHFPGPFLLLHDDAFLCGRLKCG